MTQLPTKEAQNPGPNKLLDTLIAEACLKNDAALARWLNVAPPVISKLRHHRQPVGASLLLSMHENSGIPVAVLRQLGGVPREPNGHAA